MIDVHIDGSKRWLCVCVDLREGYLRTYLQEAKTTYYEYEAAYFAIECMPNVNGEEITIFSDSKGVIDHMNKGPNKNRVIKTLVENTNRLIKAKDLTVNFMWMKRTRNLGGQFLETKIQHHRDERSYVAAL